VHAVQDIAADFEHVRWEVMGACREGGTFLGLGENQGTGTAASGADIRLPVKYGPSV